MLTYEKAYDQLVNWHCLSTRHIDKIVFQYLTATVAVSRGGKWERMCVTAIIGVLVHGQIGELVDGRGITRSFDLWKRGETVWFWGVKLPALESDFFPHEPCTKAEPRLLTYEEACERRIALGDVPGRDQWTSDMHHYLTALIAANGDKAEADKALFGHVAAAISKHTYCRHNWLVGSARRLFEEWLEGKEIFWDGRPVPAKNSDFFPWNRVFTPAILDRILGHTADGVPIVTGMTVYDPHSDGTDPVAVEVTSNHPVIIEDYSRCYSTRAAAQAMRQAKTFEQAEQACLRRRIPLNRTVAHLQHFTVAIASVCTLTREWDALEETVRRLGVSEVVSGNRHVTAHEQDMLARWIRSEEVRFRSHTIPALAGPFFPTVPISTPCGTDKRFTDPFFGIVRPEELELPMWELPVRIAAEISKGTIKPLHDDKVLVAGMLSTVLGHPVRVTATESMADRAGIFAQTVLPAVVEFFNKQMTAAETVDPLQAVEKVCKCLAAMNEMVDWHQNHFTGDITGFINYMAPITLSPEEVQSLAAEGRLSNVLQVRFLGALRDLRNVIDAKIEELT